MSETPHQTHEVLTVAEVAKLLRLSDQFVYNAVATWERGEASGLEARRYGRSVRITRAAVEAWSLASQRPPPEIKPREPPVCVPQGEVAKEPEEACAARHPDGSTCRLMPMPGRRRCRFHGGTSTGPKTPAGKRVVGENGRRVLAAVNARRRGSSP